MNQQQAAIYQRALVSRNPAAVIHVAWALHELGEKEPAYRLLERISATFGIDVPPVPIPAGFRRATAKEITKPVLAFARKALEHAMPIAKQQVAVVTNPDKTKRTVMALTEHHLDNHPARPSKGFKAGEGPAFLHPGISILTPINDPVAKNVSSTSNWVASPSGTYSNWVEREPVERRFGADVKPGGMSVEHEDAYRKALWSKAKPSWLIEGGIIGSALALFLLRKKLGLVH